MSYIYIKFQEAQREQKVYTDKTFRSFQQAAGEVLNHVAVKLDDVLFKGDITQHPVTTTKD